MLESYLSGGNGSYMIILLNSYDPCFKKKLDISSSNCTWGGGGGNSVNSLQTQLQIPAYLSSIKFSKTPQPSNSTTRLHKCFQTS